MYGCVARFLFIGFCTVIAGHYHRNITVIIGIIWVGTFTAGHINRNCIVSIGINARSLHQMYSIEDTILYMQTEYIPIFY